MAAKPPTSPNPAWDTHSGKYAYGASGQAEVLLIVPSLSGQSPEVVPRRTREELSEDERRKLEHQGVPRECHHDDPSIIKARFILDKGKRVNEVLTGDSLTCELVKRQITHLMNNTNTDTAGGEKFSIIKAQFIFALSPIVILFLYSSYPLLHWSG